MEFHDDYNCLFVNVLFRAGVNGGESVVTVAADGEESKTELLGKQRIEDGQTKSH